MQETLPDGGKSRDASEKSENCLGLAGKQSVDRGRELVAALEELQLEEEDEAQQVTAHFADHFTASPGGAT
jgi:hypothetical protein